VHFEKLKKREAHNFLRLARIEILNQRGNPEKSTQGKMSAMSAYSQPELRNPRDMSEIERQRLFQGEFTDYMRKLVTQQGNSKPKHTARGGMKAKMQQAYIYNQVALS